MPHCVEIIFGWPLMRKICTKKNECYLVPPGLPHPHLSLLQAEARSGLFSILCPALFPVRQKFVILLSFFSTCFYAIYLQICVCCYLYGHFLVAWIQKDGKLF